MNVIEEFHNQIDYSLYNSCKDRFYNADNCIECCSNPYFEQTRISYACPQKRKIYVVRYAPAYISEILDALRYTSNEFINYISEVNELKVASIGGGPGTDIAAFNKWLSHYDIPNLENIRYLRVDVHSQWDDVSPELINLYRMENVNYEYKKNVKNVSIEPIDSRSFDSFDVIMLSYIMMCQHFSGHKVKQRYAAIHSQRATNSHWRNGAVRGCKRPHYIQTPLV